MQSTNGETLVKRHYAVCNFKRKIKIKYKRIKLKNVFYSSNLMLQIQADIWQSVSFDNKALFIWFCTCRNTDSPGGAVIKKLPANAGDARDAASILAQEDPVEWEITCSSIPAWDISRTEKPSRLQSAHGVAKSRTCLSDWAHTHTHTHTHTHMHSRCTDVILI